MGQRAFYLRIADFVIHVENRSAFPMLLEEGYGPFLCDAAAPDMTVCAHAGIPDGPKDETIYSASQDGHLLWHITIEDGRYRFTVFDQDERSGVNHVAITDEGFSRWDIHCRILEQDGEQGICPLLFPMGPLLMYYLTVSHDALLVHGSAVWDGERGRVFSGFSGVGKSTMARVWEAHGATVVNDDRLIIRRVDAGYEVHNTPMFYADIPRKAPLHAIFFPYHSPENRISHLTGADAAAQMMAFCIQHGYHRQHVEHRLSCVDRLCAAIPAHALGVVPNAAIIPFIRDHEQRG